MFLDYDVADGVVGGVGVVGIVGLVVVVTAGVVVGCVVWGVVCFVVDNDVGTVDDVVCVVCVVVDVAVLYVAGVVIVYDDGVVVDVAVVARIVFFFGGYFVVVVIVLFVCYKCMVLLRMYEYNTITDIMTMPPVIVNRHTFTRIHEHFPPSRLIDTPLYYTNEKINNSICIILLSTSYSEHHYVYVRLRVDPVTTGCF